MGQDVPKRKRTPGWLEPGVLALLSALRREGKNPAGRLHWIGQRGDDADPGGLANACLLYIKHRP